MVRMLRKVSWVSPARFEPFLAACDEQNDLAWFLYEWNANVASALFECFHHTEVLLRNAMMEQLKEVHPLSYPWQQDMPTVVDAAKKRRQSETKIASPDSIISEMTLGFWLKLLDKRAENNELWRTCLFKAFPNSPGTRPAVHKAVSDMHRLRNRCAHQDSLLDFDPGIELKKLLSLVEWIDPDARKWLEKIERVSDIADARPVSPRDDVVIVGASAEMAITMYNSVAAYVCPAGRSFAQVDYMGFYHDKKIDPLFPKILDIVVPSRWTPDEQKALQSSSDPTDNHVARAMGYGLNHGWNAGEQYQVFLLSDKGSSETLKRSTPIHHKKSGRGSAFVQNKRYLPKSALLAANDTGHLN